MTQHAERRLPRCTSKAAKVSDHNAMLPAQLLKITGQAEPPLNLSPNFYLFPEPPHQTESEELFGRSEYALNKAISPHTNSISYQNQSTWI
jgi:hypothetical protein